MPWPWVLVVGLIALDPWKLESIIYVVNQVTNQVNQVVLGQTPHQKKVRVIQFVSLFPLQNLWPKLLGETWNSIEEGKSDDGGGDQTVSFALIPNFLFGDELAAASMLIIIFRSLLSSRVCH
jgi:hypothetical protein